MLYPNIIACSFGGRHISYYQLLHMINDASRAFFSLGIREGDRVMLCLPNSPIAVYSLYGLNRIGAVVCPIHPLSTSYEIQEYLNLTQCRCAITLDLFWEKFDTFFDTTSLEKVIIHSIAEDLALHLKPLYWLAKGRKTLWPKRSERYLFDMEVKRVRSWDPKQEREIELQKDRTHELAVILFSGGTTGKPKGVMLSNGNFNAFAQQISSRGKAQMLGIRLLGILPIFHGYGLGMGIHAMLFLGGSIQLIPSFTPQTLPKLIMKKKPQYLPTIPRFLDEIIHQLSRKHMDMSFIQMVNTGGDFLSQDLKDRFEQFVKDRGGDIHVTVGYGLTETVAGCIASPEDQHRQGSIGKPFAGNTVKIVKLNTTETASTGAEGEICINGPTVMMGYLDHPEETARVLRTHSDGKTWLHTGDMGWMDEDGYVFFRQRIRRMIKVSGMMVYPAQVEEVLNTHPGVAESCVIGVEDPVRGQKVKAFVVPKAGIDPSDGSDLRDVLHAHCLKHLIRWRCPELIEFRNELPKTLIGKVAYHQLTAKSEALRGEE